MRSLSHEAFYRRLPCLLRHGEQRFSILIRNGWICSVFKQDAHKVCVAVVGGPHGWSHVNRCSGWGARVHLGPRSKERTQCAEVATNGGGVECGLAILAALPTSTPASRRRSTSSPSPSPAANISGNAARSVSSSPSTGTAPLTSRTPRSKQRRIRFVICFHALCGCVVGG